MQNLTITNLMTTGAKCRVKPLCTLPMGCCDSSKARSRSKVTKPTRHSAYMCPTNSNIQALHHESFVLFISM